MRTSRVATYLFIILLVSISPIVNAGVAEYQVIDLGAFQTIERGFNNSGQVLGYDNVLNKPVFWNGQAFIEVGLPETGTTASPTAINGRGDILLNCAVGTWTPFLRTDGIFSPLPGLNNVTAVNSNRVIVGTADFSDPFIGTATHAAILTPDWQIIDLGTLGGYFSHAWDISENGRVVGCADTAGNGPTRAFLWENGVMRDLGGLTGSTFNEARAISNNGVYAVVVSQMVNRVQGRTVSINRSLRWDGAKTSDMGTLGGAYADARDVNNSGIVVGNSQNSKGNYSGYRCIPGKKMESLNLLIGSAPYYITCAQGINDQGDIYCEGYNTVNKNVIHALILKKITTSRI